jgi:hypothetical protein
MEARKVFKKRLKLKDFRALHENFYCFCCSSGAASHSQLCLNIIQIPYLGSRKTMTIKQLKLSLKRGHKNSFYSYLYISAAFQSRRVAGRGRPRLYNYQMIHFCDFRRFLLQLLARSGVFFLCSLVEINKIHESRTRNKGEVDIKLNDALRFAAIKSP